jgi:hypothetical protein
MNINFRLVTYVSLFFFLAFFSAIKKSFSFDFYVGDESRRVDIYSKGPTLIFFPAPVIASSCLPEGKLDFFKVNEVNDLYESTADLNTLNEIKVKPLDLFLKLIPLKTNGGASCSFSLQNGSIINLEFSLKEDIFRPLLKIKEFQNSMSLKSETKIQNLLLELIHGRPNHFKEITPKQTLMRNDTMGQYKVTYVGQFDDLKGIILEMTVYGPMVIPQRLEGPEVGQVYYSAILQDRKNIYKTSKKTTLKVILMIRADITAKEILRYLPTLGRRK